MIKYINPTSQFYQFGPNWTKSPIRINTSPRIFNFSQNTKLTKLNIIDHVYNIIGTKPSDKFQKKWFESSKTPIWIVPKIPMKCMNKCMKTWNKMQKEGYNGLTGLERGKPCKRNGRKRQKNWDWALTKSYGERKVKKTFWKKCLTKPKISF